MPKARKRKVPVTVAASAGPSASTPPTPATAGASGSGADPGAPTSVPASRKTRAVIRRFHVLLKRRAQLTATSDVETGAATHAREKDEIDAELAALGGLAAYQHMSAAGQSSERGGSSAKLLISWLKEHGLHRRPEGERLRLLDVGALRPDNYATCAGWIEVLPIDLRSRVAGVQEQDFLLLDLAEHAGAWDTIALSLVLNFVPSPTDRGQMLRVAHAALRSGGLLFVALPAPCVQNSRYLTPEHFTALLADAGFQQLEHRARPGGRMAYWLFRSLLASSAKGTGAFEKKRVLRTGADRNNFCITLG